ncbi:MAG: double-strand break repair helicase AddA [Proteobacteria bacterium]|nr:double-strand break repair helicase AddA [Pseudomonadota bacterium]
MPHHIAASSQRLAAHPHHSAWVAASAGSGKTKVLTDRALNLLLEGCAPERILCLTFTKAAAAEMEGRLRARLGEWAILPDCELQKSLESLRGTAPSSETFARARTLFGLTLDTPGGLKIQTIHGFCQSLLKRFPLEADLSPFFNVVDETERKILIKKAFYIVIEDPTFQDLVLRFSESTFEEMNTFILQERVVFEELVPHCHPRLRGDDKGEYAGEGERTHLTKYIPEEKLKKALPLFQQGSPMDRERGNGLGQFLAVSQEEREQRYEDYLSLFLTQKGEARARLVTQKLVEAYPDLKELLIEEAHRLERWVERQKTLEIMAVSQSFTDYSRAFLKAYADLKKAQSLLDYEDLILKTVALLKNPGCHWVLYKLDGGLDHILVDEAQDTSPTQWQVVRAIAEEFYANAADDPRNRTLFIVGDDKQSIYSFQGADPVVFTQMQQDLRAFAQNSGKIWQDIDLNVSFRSTPEILAVVDEVFPSFPNHLPFRKEMPGHVEVWPLLTKEEEPPLESWQPPLVQSPKESPQKRLAQLMAQTIQGWLLGKGPLPRSISPGDILILVRRRTAFVDTLIRTLKEHNVPVAGIDRLWLLEGIGIQDLLKIGEFLLLPEDDLTLATVLKGPLFDLSEEDLFTLAYDRGNRSLWQCLLKNEQFGGITSLLKTLLSRTDFLTPFELYSHILGPLGGRKKWQARLGMEILDSLDEFLNLCLLFQEEKTPSLQGFIYWISQEVIELKRDLEQSNQVRVMTVHGSKGLQAPIVFLPDTTQPPFDLPPFGFYKDSLIWLPPSDKDIPLTKALKQELRDAQFEEYRRLLYVALTRAEDALYVCGWEGSAQESWYSLVTEGIQKIGEKCDGGWRLSSVKAGSALSVQDEEKPHFLLPQWLQTQPLLEMSPKLLHPSQEEDDDRVTPSVWGEIGTQRGILIHKLLEILPGIQEVRREKTALRYLEKEGISTDMALGMIHSVQETLKAYPDLFGPHSQGEVPIMGYLGESLLSGQIDRLVVNEDQILIVDFKTHGVVPERLEDISTTYLKQMAIYHVALSHIYPERTISCGLLWTEEPRLDLLPESLLKKFMPFCRSSDTNETKRVSAII